MGIIAPDIGIDLGSKNTVVYVAGEGVCISEQTALLILGKKGKKKKVLAIGESAYNKIGRTTMEESVVRPISNDGEDVETLLEPLIRHFIRRAVGSSNIIRPRLFIAISSNMRAKSRRELRKIAYAAGGRKNGIYLVEKAYASALGVGIDARAHSANMVVDIGASTTEIAIIASKNFIYKSTLLLGGSHIDAAIARMILNSTSAVIGDKGAEQIKIDEGSAIPVDVNSDVFFTAVDNITNKGEYYRIPRSKVCDVIGENLQKIIDEIKQALNSVGADTVSDIYRNGIHLTGGISQLGRIEELFEKELKIPIIVSGNPMKSTAEGLGRMVENADALNEICDIDFLKDEE